MQMKKNWMEGSRIFSSIDSNPAGSHATTLTYETNCDNGNCAPEAAPADC